MSYTELTVRPGRVSAFLDKFNMWVENTRPVDNDEATHWDKLKKPVIYDTCAVRRAGNCPQQQSQAECYQCDHAIATEKIVTDLIQELSPKLQSNGPVCTNLKTQSRLISFDQEGAGMITLSHHGDKTMISIRPHNQRTGLILPTKLCL